MSRHRQSLDHRLAEIEGYDVPALRAEWAALYGHPVPARLSRDLLVRAVAYGIQAEQWGGLRPALRRQLERLTDGGRESGTTTPPRARSLQPGIRLMREWNGQTHVVEALTDGFAWRGKRYRSLSAVARAITGARWSGPRFFGLRDTPSSGADREV